LQSTNIGEVNPMPFDLGHVGASAQFTKDTDAPPYMFDTDIPIDSPCAFWDNSRHEFTVI
jgi:hypothetical protein